MNSSISVRNKYLKQQPQKLSQPNWILFLVLQGAISLLMQRVQILATLHALLVLVIGLLVVFSSKPSRVIFVGGYIVGAEVLWRMTGAGVFWEYGKYALILLFGLTFLRTSKTRPVVLPVLFFLLLLPSAFITIQSLELWIARQEISFNLSGPLSLAVSAMYFSQLKLRWKDLEQLGWAVVISLSGVCVLIVQSILNASSITFTDDSNFVTSGGFGPNQVSAVLGLGAAVLFLLIVVHRETIKRWIAFMLMIIFAGFSAFTFSRGGIYSLSISVLMALVHLIPSRAYRTIILLILTAGGLLGGYIIYPRLEEMSGGMFSQRFSSFDTSGRIEIAASELSLWSESPVWGVGPGMAKYIISSRTGFFAAAHTEFTRIIAEHGILGGFALVILLVIALRAYLQAPGLLAKTWVAACIGWSLAEMSHAAMRLASIGFMFGLAMIQWQNSIERDSLNQNNESPVHR